MKHSLEYQSSLDAVNNPDNYSASHVLIAKEFIRAYDQGFKQSQEPTYIIRTSDLPQSPTVEELLEEFRNSPMILVNRQEEEISPFFIQHRHTDKEYSFAAVMPPCGSAIGFLRLNQSPDKDSPQGIDAMISNLSVSDSERGKGWGNAVLQELESIASQNGADEVFLFVDIDSWMHAWYLRKGYSYWADNIEQPETVWLRKEFQKSTAL